MYAAVSRVTSLKGLFLTGPYKQNSIKSYPKTVLEYDRLRNKTLEQPLEYHKYTLNKQEFWDVIRLRYNLPIPKPSFQMCLSCKKGGFVTHRHNELRDITEKLLSEVYKDEKSNRC